MAKKKREFWVVHIGGDRSWVSAHRSNHMGDDADKIQPPPGKFYQVYIPNTYDWMFIADMDTLKDPKFIKKNILPHGLLHDYGDAVLDYAGVKWRDNNDNWTYFKVDDPSRF